MLLITISIITLNIFLPFIIVFCSSKKKKTRSNEISRSSKTNNINNSNKSLKFIPVKVEPPSRESTSNRIKKCSPAPTSKNAIKVQKVKPKTAKNDITKENATSSDFVKQEIRTTTGGASTTKETKDKTLTCEMDTYLSERLTTNEETTVVQNATTETTGAYDNLTVPSEKEKEKIDLS